MRDHRTPRSDSTPKRELSLKIQTSWLTERVDEPPTYYHRGMTPTSTLRIRGAWQQLKNRAQPGDEMWAFASPASRWSSRVKYTGFALVRNGQIVETVLTRE